MEVRAVIHFAVPAAPGAPGAPNLPPGGNLDKLPPVLKAAIAGKAPRYVFACNPRLASSAQHVMSNLAGEVNCVKCRATRAWIDAPDDGPRPKDPGAPGDDGLQEYLARPEPAKPTAVAAAAPPAESEGANGPREQGGEAGQLQAEAGKAPAQAGVLS